MNWTVITRLFVAFALVLAGTQFTHSSAIHAGIGHLGHEHDVENASVGEAHAGYAHERNNASLPVAPVDPLQAEGGLHCGAPLMAVFGQNIPISRLLLQFAAPIPVNPLLTTQFNLDPPPPRI